MSEIKTLRSGVPQGSVLGPVLFTLYINDLPSILPASIKSKVFADDFKCYSKIETTEDLETFSVALNGITKWARDWQLPVSTEKSSMMLFSNSLNLLGGQNLSLDNEMLKSLPKTLDLGVTFDSDFRFKSQINIACN